MATNKYAPIITSGQELVDIISYYDSSRDNLQHCFPTIDMCNLIGYTFAKEYNKLPQMGIVNYKFDAECNFRI